MLDTRGEAQVAHVGRVGEQLSVRGARGGDHGGDGVLDPAVEVSDRQGLVPRDLRVRALRGAVLVGRRHLCASGVRRRRCSQAVRALAYRWAAPRARRAHPLPQPRGAQRALEPRHC
eukprot:Amastigsp_a511353_11.p3 type:complete len:117 gc:universal Amastigsp_a511353_11:517-867(+)